ncbi:hypothetical protein GCM10018793_44260 [Streptomyces sulfonofaciens]|uniref:4Fe4S-binding SPASM domain-containing protein n=1 Tax=Streptomyces sulfonofaciens TaxID=68272 RepID=A0A919GEP6_9ACTN|nr:SPASM domain-containing protein [Streptomyces sulfonofaciens]GHH83076.1 hypothetical protein GCM10018793_44260 [Streptomyces sulfonofaciens]
MSAKDTIRAARTSGVDPPAYIRLARTPQRQIDEGVHKPGRRIARPERARTSHHNRKGQAVTPITDTSAKKSTTRLLWLDLTRRCQLECTHCYNASGPNGDHGTMTRDDWAGVLDQAASCGVLDVQFIGGEPTTLATSYYSHRAAEHNAMTGRPSHARTRANIEKAVRLGVPLRVGVVSGSDAQCVSEARREFEALGVTRITVDHVRPFGRGAQDRAPDPANLCGRCGVGTAAVSPTGEVSPCVFSGWMNVGNVQDAPLAGILGGAAMAKANISIRSSARNGGGDDESGDHCDPGCDPNAECSPGFPSGECDPRR